MFAYLTKKISIPSNVTVSAVAWNKEGGYIAVGGTGGFLKVLQMDDGNTNGAKPSVSLSMNQTLIGHEGTISAIIWNEKFSKLTSSDSSGLITVWALHRGIWFQEMLNSRNKSSICDLTWNAEGSNICIVYSDGNIVVGSVNGARLWGADLKTSLKSAAWSPDGRLLLFGSEKGEVNVHDSFRGQFLNKMHIKCLSETDPTELLVLRWQSGWVESFDSSPSLLIAFCCGKLQIMRREVDDQSIIVDTGLELANAEWSPQRDVIAVMGSQRSHASENFNNVIRFYSADGLYLRTLDVQGKIVKGLAWEGKGRQLAVGVDSSIYFASLRPNYKFTFLSGTAVYVCNKPGHSHTQLMFWNTESNEKNIKNVRDLLHICSGGDACLIVSRESSRSAYLIQLVDSIGGPIESQEIDFYPLVCVMNISHIVCCGDENIFIWKYRDPSVTVETLDPIVIQISRSNVKQRIVHIGEAVKADTPPSMTCSTGRTNDLICAAGIGKEYLFIGRESGVVNIYRLESFVLLGRLMLPSKPQALFPNLDSSCLAILHSSGSLNLASIDLDKLTLPPRPAVLIGTERKDVWNFLWANDAPDMYAFMKKTKLYICDGKGSEEPISTMVQLCKFESLTLIGIDLDTIMENPERPAKEAIYEFETNYLVAMREKIGSLSLKGAYKEIDANPLPTFWALLAEHALFSLDFAYAEMAFIRCQDYPSIQFVKRVRGLDDPKKQLAEINAFYLRFEEAENIFLNMDRKDLAMEMRARLGGWFRVLQLVEEGAGDEVLVRRAWEHIGNYYADRQKWTKAAKYYSRCNQLDKLCMSFYIIGDFAALRELSDLAEYRKDIQKKIGWLLSSVGLVDEAVDAFLRAEEPRTAINVCIQQNQWGLAMKIASDSNFSDVGQQLDTFASSLLQRHAIPQAIELYRTAGQHNKAAKVLAQLGHDHLLISPLLAKKFYVLSAFEIDAFRRSQLSLGSNDSASVVNRLLSDDQASVADRTLDAGWRGAEALHFFIMSQRHLRNHNFDLALLLAMRLCSYEEIIRPIDIYSLMALAAYAAKNYGLCSKAFTRLEGIESGESEMTTNTSEDSGSKTATNGLGSLNLIDSIGDLDVKGRSLMLNTWSQASSFGLNTATGGDMTRTSLQLGGAMVHNQTTNTGQMVYPTISFDDPPRRFADLAGEIFTLHEPEDISLDSVKCLQCSTMNKEWSENCSRCGQPFPVCILTGKAISDEPSWLCTSCNHRAIKKVVELFENCPLCHSPRIDITED